MNDTGTSYPDETISADAPAGLPKGHIIENGVELKKCPGTPHTPDHQTHYAPLSDFGTNKAHKDGLTRVCKPGWAAYTKALKALAPATEKAPKAPKAEGANPDGYSLDATPKAKAPKAPTAKQKAAEAARNQVRREGKAPRAKKATAPAATTAEA